MAGRPSFSSSSSSSFSYEWKYDVFLSFRGQDTRFGFTGNLYKALHDKGIHTFFDDDELQRGDQIAPAILDPIEKSRIVIPIFSRHYASSSFCLEELVKIIHCIKEKGRLVLPVFYDVDPSHVRHQRGSFGKALAMHVESFSKYDKEKLEDNMERLKKRKMALKEAANLAGDHFQLRNEYEHEFIEKIVKVVSNKINRAPLHVADYPAGLESRVLEVNSLLDVGFDDVVHMVGIHGIGGIGKTTLAREVYNSIADSFQCSCFLGSVRENSMKQGLVHLQEMLLSKIVGGKDIKLGDVCEGISIIKHRLQWKKVLLILDDVDKLEQLQAMVGGPDWFGPGSRVIITTRDKHLLESHGVERTCELDGLNMREAIELLNWKAFRTNKVDPCYVDILNRGVTYTSRLPFALEVIGSKLFGKSVEDWESALVNEPFCHPPTKVDLYSDSTTSRLATDRVLKRTQFIEYLGSELENWEDDPQRPGRSSKTTKSRSKRKSVGPTSSKSKSLEWDTLENPKEEPTIAPKSKEKTIGESPMKSAESSTWPLKEEEKSRTLILMILLNMISKSN